MTVHQIDPDLEVTLDIEETILEIEVPLTLDLETGEDNTSGWEMVKVKQIILTDSSMQLSSVLVAITLFPRLPDWHLEKGMTPLVFSLEDVNAIILQEDWSDTRQVDITILTPLDVRFL